MEALSEHPISSEIAVPTQASAVEALQVLRDPTGGQQGDYSNELFLRELEYEHVWP